MLFWLLLLAPTLVTADRFCLQNNTDLCLGFSGPVGKLPVLQLKSWYDLITNNDEGRLNFTLSKRLQYGNLVVDNVGLGYAGLANVTKARGVIWNGTQLVLNGTTKCLTAMQCLSGTQDFCHPNTIKATRMYQMQKGSYIGFKPCSTSISQFFVLNPDCAPGCSPELLSAPVCTRACLQKTCHYNASLCATGRPTTPTWFPTFSYTAGRPTSEPTSQPTQAPSGPLRGPTYQPTHQPTHEPTFEPTNQPSEEPTSQPTYQPTYQPTSQPTKEPALDVTLQPSGLPALMTQSPTPRPAGTSPPTGLSYEQKVGLGVGLGLGILLILLVIVLVLFLRRKNNSPPGTPVIRLNPPTSDSQAVV